jgi:hypothetical protein
LSRFLVLPVASLGERPVEGNGPGSMAIIDTTPAVPAFFGMEDDGRLAFPGVRDIHIHLAMFYALVAAVAYLRIKDDRIIGCRHIGQGVHFLNHGFLLYISLLY